MIVQNTDDRVELLLNAGHGEYVPAQHEVAWQPSYDGEMDEEADLASAHAALGEAGIGALDLDTTNAGWSTIVRIVGTPSQVAHAFHELREQVATVPSGDDDTFDYWPSGARLLLAFAHDMDVIAGTTDFSDGREPRESTLLNRDILRVRAGEGFHEAWAARVIADVLRAKHEFADELAGKVGVPDPTLANPHREALLEIHKYLHPENYADVAAHQWSPATIEWVAAAVEAALASDPDARFDR